MSAEFLAWNPASFGAEVERRSRAQVGACYQCHKCSSGCPVADRMDWVSSQVLRLIQLGAEKLVLGSEAIWLCASCQTCTTRCPNGIDVAGVMDTLRMMAVERKTQLGTKRDAKFSRSFLGSVRRHGRAFELELLLTYKLKTLDFFSDIDKAPRMLARRKLKLLPSRSPSVREVRRIFRRATREEKSR